MANLELILGKNNHILVQLFRYTFVGGAAFIVDFVTLFCLTSFLHVFYLVSASIAFSVGVLINYLLSTSWVFAHRKIDHRGMEFLIFAVIGLFGLGLNDITMWFFTGLVGMYYLLSKIIATGLVYFFNFFVRKQMLF
ncbi:MAG: GtrA family protein [Gammaproteobacteria bacterium]|jgi:putative flippase GtrA